MNFYRALNKQEYQYKEFRILPLRLDDRFQIMEWRNQQLYHLRQQKLLTPEDQDRYFNEVVTGLFSQERPPQVLFSFLQNEALVGYGGLVHINWLDKNAEISFLMNTALENQFHLYWSVFLKLLERVAFAELGLHKIYTYAFDLRPHLYPVLEDNQYTREATLKEHCKFEDRFIDVIIHSKIGKPLMVRPADSSDLEQTYEWANDQAIRAFSKTKNYIPFEEHTAWFRKKISDANSLYLMAEYCTARVGTVRFDKGPTGEALLSYLIDPLYQGVGFGKLLVMKGIEYAIKTGFCNKMIAHVHHDNASSIRILEATGFEQAGSEDAYLIYQKQVYDH